MALFCSVSEGSFPEYFGLVFLFHVASILHLCGWSHVGRVTMSQRRLLGYRRMFRLLRFVFPIDYLIWIIFGCLDAYDDFFDVAFHDVG